MSTSTPPNTLCKHKKRLAQAQKATANVRRCSMRASARDAAPAKIAFRRLFTARCPLDGETPAALQPTRLQDQAAIVRAHAPHKAVLAFARQALGLPCSLHMKIAALSKR